MKQPREIVQAIADAFLPPPGNAHDSPDMQKYAASLEVAAIAVGAQFFLDAGTAKDKALFLRGVFYEKIDETYDLLGKAKTSGIEIPNNPFISLSQMNVGRQLFSSLQITDVDASRIVSDIRTVSKFVESVKSGKFSLKQNPLSSYVQISSFALGTQGIGGSSNNLIGFNPGADSFKVNRALEALSSLNFSKRIPRVMFTADFSPDGISSKGALIGWRKMQDASGYIVTRHSVFENKDVKFTVSNADLAKSTESVIDYVENWILSFYDNINTKNVFVWLDDTVKANNFYTYSIVAYQDSLPTVGSIFAVNKLPIKLTPAKLLEIQSEISQMVASRPALQTNVKLATLRNQQSMELLSVRVVGQELTEEPTSVPDGLVIDDVSPYPHLSKKIYGDSRYDWIIAAMNVRAAFDRKENIETMRSFSYLGSKFSFINSQMDRGNFFVPENLGEVVNRVEQSIMNFGVTRTLIEILDTTGLLFFFGEKDVSADGYGSGVALDGGLLAAILAAIDPETATIDPRALTTNMLSAVKNSSGLSISSIKELDQVSLETSHQTDDVIADEAAQYVGDLKQNGTLIDLTTFEGMSRLIRTIRTYFDFNTNRGK